MSVRVRFAPSPTGFLHVGGARTAIFNWLFARRQGGAFVLRVEDTDAERSSDEMVQAILDGMAWLGMTPDEGPHFQSRERGRHVADAERLLEAGRAYPCFCAPDALRQAREAAERAGTGWIYPGTCRRLGPERVARRRAGEAAAVRFEVGAGRVEWDDLVHGPTAFDRATIEDFVILRSDGTPTYMLSVVSDDLAMEITHVIRGDDHLSNTPKQILLYEALGRPVPRFAHLPLILGPDRKRLSKRHGAVSVLAYRDRGYLPEAMFNFLALLGFAPGAGDEKLDRAELVRRFDLAAVGRSGAVFDLDKLDWLNGRYLAELPAERLAELARPHLAAAGLWRESFEGPERAWLSKTLLLVQPRARRLDELPELARPYLEPGDELDYEEQAARKHLAHEGLGELVAALAAQYETVERWEPGELERVLRELAERHGVPAGRLIHPARLAVTGRGASPGLFEVLELLGRDKTIRRLERLVAHLDGNR